MANMGMLMNEHEVMTVRDLAAYLQVHASTIYRLLKRGQLPAFKVGRDWRFNREQIDKWRMAQGQNGHND